VLSCETTAIHTQSFQACIVCSLRP